MYNKRYAAREIYIYIISLRYIAKVMKRERERHRERERESERDTERERNKTHSYI